MRFKEVTRALFSLLDAIADAEDMAAVAELAECRYLIARRFGLELAPIEERRARPLVLATAPGLVVVNDYECPSCKRVSDAPILPDSLLGPGKPSCLLCLLDIEAGRARDKH